MEKNGIKPAKIAMIFTALYILFYYLWIIIFKDNKSYLVIGGNFFQTVAPIIAGIWGLAHFKKINGKLKYFWLLSSTASICYAIGMFIYTVDQVFFGIVGAYAGISDIFWLLSIFVYMIALIFVNSIRNAPSKMVQFIFDIIIVMVVATSISWHFIIKPILNYSLDQGILYTIVYVSYPIGNLAILFAVLYLFYSSKNILSRKVFLLNIVGFSILLYANMIYMYLVVNNTYYTGSLYDPLWSLAILLLGLASFYSLEEAESVSTSIENLSPDGHLRDFLSIKLILPYLSVIIIFVFMIFSSSLELNSIVIGSILSTLLIIIRQVFTLVQNNGLLRQTQVLNKHLELIVDQRTNELYLKNQQLKETITKVEYIAYHDSLTLLTNRRGFEKQALLAIEEARYIQSALAIFFIDLDRFKFINDTLGHSVGDLLLKKVALILQENVGPGNIVSRQGGDEFMILLKNITKEETEYLAKKILTELENPINIHDNELFITSSIGISMYPKDGEHFDTLIKRADTSMYSAKEMGKNCYKFFDDSMDEHIETKVILETSLRKAFERNELMVYYQPKLDLHSNTIIGVEALLRWKHKKYGFISPTTFIPIAEEIGLIIRLGDWVLREACLQLKKWQNQSGTAFVVSVNVSTIQFLQKDFVKKVEMVLSETLLDPQYLELEITESTMMDTEEVVSILVQLKQLGIKISVDDFGSGYSSLSHIKKLPIDTLKIDKTFIEEIDSELNDVAIVSTIITLAKNLNLKVIAEGVENEMQLEILKDKGCDQIQGYYLSPPIPVHQFNESFLNKIESTVIFHHI